MQATLPQVKLERLLTAQAAAAGQSLSEFLESLINVFRLAEPTAYYVRSVPEMQEWLLTEKGQAKLQELLDQRYDLIRAVRIHHLAEEARRTKPAEPPAWLAEIKSQNPPLDGTNGVHRAVGAWPGDETDEGIREALERIS